MVLSKPFELRLSYSNVFRCYRTLSCSHMHNMHTNSMALEYRECIGVLCFSVQRLHQCEISSDPSSRHREHVRIAVQWQLELRVPGLLKRKKGVQRDITPERNCKFLIKLSSYGEGVLIHTYTWELPRTAGIQPWNKKLHILTFYEPLNCLCFPLHIYNWVISSFIL